MSMLQSIESKMCILRLSTLLNTLKMPVNGYHLPISSGSTNFMNTNKKAVAVVMVSFIVMSFVDLVGVATDYVKSDLNLSDGIVQFISSAAFLWFFVFSVPTGLMQARFGKRNVLSAGILLSAVGLILPFLSYGFTSVLIGFSFLGIGNAIIQVSANPLLISVSGSEKAASWMSLSQFIKSVGSMAAPFLAGFLASQVGDWKWTFVVFAVVSVLSVVLLYSVNLKEDKSGQLSNTTIGSCLNLLGNKYVALMVLGIFLIVGIDVGINAVSGQFMIEKFQMKPDVAAKGRSLYFFGKLIGCFLGAVLLTKFKPRTFLNLTSTLLCAALLVFAFYPVAGVSVALLAVIGFFGANIFPLIFTLAVGNLPEKSNEISGLMMMAISGGAVIPPVMGFIAGKFNYTISMLFLLACAAVIVLIGLTNKSQEQEVTA
ncbi:MAG: sugar MFS transporter [Planctomycetes bacterium]|nr:sugar MFS transporter [Planctomycetota bacterium]